MKPCTLTGIVTEDVSSNRKKTFFNADDDELIHRSTVRDICFKNLKIRKFYDIFNISKNSYKFISMRIPTNCIFEFTQHQLL